MAGEWPASQGVHGGAARMGSYEPGAGCALAPAGRRQTPHRALREHLEPHHRPLQLGRKLVTTQQMPSSLEIAQACQLRPVADIASELGLLDEEFEPYGRYKGK